MSIRLDGVPSIQNQLDPLTLLNQSTETLRLTIRQRDEARALAAQEVGRINQLENDVQLLQVRARTDEIAVRNAQNTAADANRRAREETEARLTAEFRAQVASRASAVATEANIRAREAAETKAQQILNQYEQAVREGQKALNRAELATTQVVSANTKVVQIQAEIQEVRNNANEMARVEVQREITRLTRELQNAQGEVNEFTTSAREEAQRARTAEAERNRLKRANQVIIAQAQAQQLKAEAAQVEAEAARRLLQDGEIFFDERVRNIDRGRAEAEQRADRNAADANTKRDTEEKNKNLIIFIIIAGVLVIVAGIVAIIFGVKNKASYLWITGTVVVSLAALGILIYFYSNIKSRTNAGLGTAGTYIGGKFVAANAKIGPGFPIVNPITEFTTLFKVFFGGIASLLIGGGIALLFTGIRNDTAEFNTGAIGCLVAGVFTLFTILFAFNTEVIQKNFTQIIVIHLVLIASIVFTLLGFMGDSNVNTQGQSKTLWGFSGPGIGLFVIFLIGFITFYLKNRNNNMKSIFMQNFYNIFIIFLLAAAFTGGVSMLIITLTTDNNEHLAIPSVILLILGVIGAIVAKKYVKFSKE